jgi:ferredoxin
MSNYKMIKKTTEGTELHGGKEWICDKNSVFLRVLHGFSSLFVIAHINMFSLSKVLVGCCASRIKSQGTTAMTGNQPHPVTGRTTDGSPASAVSIARVLEALGVKHIVTANPFDIKSAKEAAASLFNMSGVRAVIFEGPCVRLGKTAAGAGPLVVNDRKCTRCKLCITHPGCPAVSLGFSLTQSPDSGAGGATRLPGASLTERPERP